MFCNFTPIIDNIALTLHCIDTIALTLDFLEYVELIHDIIVIATDSLTVQSNFRSL